MTIDGVGLAYNTKITKGAVFTQKYSVEIINRLYRIYFKKKIYYTKKEFE